MEAKFRFVDVFAGLGGFHVALEHLGGECVFAAELQPYLQDLYKINFGIQPFGDITKIDPNDVPDHDVLTAGFPCQPFSKAGEQLGFECTKQGNLFFNIVSILEAKKPTYFILENVPNLLKHDNGKTWLKIQEILGEEGLGYEIKTEKLSPHYFGIPQIRERVYILGSLKGLNHFVWPLIPNSTTSVETVLENTPINVRPLPKQVIECLNTWHEFLKAVPDHVKLPSFPIWTMEWGSNYPFEDTTPHAILLSKGNTGLLPYTGSHGAPLSSLSADNIMLGLPSHARTPQLKFPVWKKTFIRQNRKFYEDNRAWIDPWLPNILKFPSSLQKFEWNVQGGKKDIWEYVIQFRASGVRVKRRTTAPSLIAMTSTQVPIIGWQKRYMTIRECAKLQSLESLKQFPLSNDKAYKALGNAVNSHVAEYVANALLSSHINTYSDNINIVSIAA